MSRRNRTPHIKGHRWKRNKNPKLSPFQREQKRNRLANQPPIAMIKGNERDCPVSQRAVTQYLMDKRKRQLQRGRENGGVEVVEQNNTVVEESAVRSSPHDLHCVPSSAAVSVKNEACAVGGEKRRREKGAAKQKSAEGLEDAVVAPPGAQVVLNEQIAASLARPILAFRTRTDRENVTTDGSGLTDDNVGTIVARKKAKKHLKKAGARRERIRQRLEELEKTLVNELALTKGSKKRSRTEPSSTREKFLEKNLKKMLRENGVTDALGGHMAGSAKKHMETGDDVPVKKCKRVTFAESGAGAPVPSADGPHRPMRYPNDRGERRVCEFYELVDVVGHGERVEAPPVFDVLPKRSVALTRLATRLGSAAPSVKGSKNGKATRQSERLRLLSAVGNIGMQRRLERLGLAPADNTTTIRGTDSSAGQRRPMSKEEEMRELREHVMEAYRRKRRAAVEAKNGTDMWHEFPLFS